MDSHRHGASADRHAAGAHAVSHDRARRLQIVLGLNVAIVVAQLVAGVIASSLGLVADAAHNLGDVAGVVVSLVAVRLARRAPSPRRSYGYHRAGLLAAQANGTSILVVGGIIAFAAIQRLGDHQPVDGPLVFTVAAVALVANLGSSLVLHAHADDLNMRSAALHMTADAAASAGVMVGGLVIWITGSAYWIDPAISLVIVAVTGWHAFKLLRDAADVVLQTTPAHIDYEGVRSDLAQIEGVTDVHDLHLWSLATGMDVASAHVMVHAGTDLHAVLDQARHVLADRHQLRHATVQVEPDDHTGCEELDW